MKTVKSKELLLAQLKKIPIVQIACEKVGVGRSTYYYWRKQSKKFANECDKAISEGILMMNDMAESQLINAVRSGNISAIAMWLKHHHQDYETRVKVDGRIRHESEELSPEQEKIVAKALGLVGLLPEEVITKEGDDNERR
jgi:ACT domain-containing protein